MNWLEQLVREFYEVQGYWVQTKVRFGPTGHGGYIGEADVLAYAPQRRLLVHVETSEGADSWEKTKGTFQQKFKKAADYYNEIFPLPIDEVERIAVAGWILKPAPIEIPGVQILTAYQFAQRVMDLLAETYSGGKVPPEQYPLLRALYLALRLDKEAK